VAPGDRPEHSPSLRRPADELNPVRRRLDHALPLPRPTLHRRTGHEDQHPPLPARQGVHQADVPGQALAGRRPDLAPTTRMLPVSVENDEVLVGERFSLAFQRTLRIPEDGRTYPLPPGLGRLPVLRAADFAQAVPTAWVERDDLFLPLY